MKFSKRLFAVVSVIFTVLLSLSQGILNARVPLEPLRPLRQLNSNA
jgi:hypothetical protein